MNERDAFHEWRRLDTLDRHWRHELRRIDFDIECLRTDIETAIDTQKSSLASEVSMALAENPRYRKIVDAFLDLRGYHKNLNGWRAACRQDGGLWKKTRGLGWERLWRAILESRKLRSRERTRKRDSAAGRATSRPGI